MKKNRMRIRSIAFLIFLLFSCGNLKRENIDTSDSSSLKVSKREFDVFSCDSFKQNLKRIELNNFEFNVLNIDKTNLTSGDKSLDFLKKGIDGQTSYIYGYSEIDSCTIIIYDEIEYDNLVSRLTMKSIDSQGRVLNEFLLSEHISYPDAEMTIVTRVNGNQFIKSKILVSIGDFDEDVDRYMTIIDSVSYVYELHNGNNFKFLNSDSVRFLR